MTKRRVRRALALENLVWHQGSRRADREREGEDPQRVTPLKSRNVEFCCDWIIFHQLNSLEFDGAGIPLLFAF